MEYEFPSDPSYRCRFCSRFDVHLHFTLNKKRQDSWPGGHTCADGLEFLQETIWFHSRQLEEDRENDVSIQGAWGEFGLLTSFATANDTPPQHRIVVVTGEQGRKVFFNDQSLDLGEGYKILFGSATSLADINMHDDSRAFIHRFLSLIRKERLSDGAYFFSFSHWFLIGFSSVLPVLLDDLNGQMLDWGTKGKIDPFKEVYDVRSILVSHQALPLQVHP